MAPTSHDQIAHGKQVREVLGSLPRDAAGIFERLLAEPDLDPAGLWWMLRGQLVALRKAEAEDALVEGDLGKALADSCEHLLYRMSETEDSDARLLIQAAVRYFVLNEDAKGDLESLGGFDDDVLVFNAVVEALGHRDLIVEP